MRARDARAASTATAHRVRSIASALALATVAASVVACGWDPRRPFEREAPAVNRALAHLDGGDARAAVTTLEEYLSTGACTDGNIGTPDRVRERPNGTFDLGLALFRIGEAYGRPFGDEESDAGAGDETMQKLRRAEIDCALRVVRAMSADANQPIDLRARAHYLEGNLNFLDAQYEEAVKAYDKSLALDPARVDAGDPNARGAAWNRAIAMRRIEDKKDAGNDGGGDSGSSDGGSDGGGDSGKSGDSGRDDKKDSGGDNGGNDASSAPDASQPPPEAGAPDASPPKPNEQEAGAPPPPARANQDERILDQLEGAPTLQQEAVRKAAGRRQVRGMADK